MKFMLRERDGDAPTDIGEVLDTWTETYRNGVTHIVGVIAELPDDLGLFLKATEGRRFEIWGPGSTAGFRSTNSHPALYTLFFQSDYD